MPQASLQASRWAPSAARRANTFTASLQPSLSVPVSCTSSAERQKIAQILAFQKFIRCLRRLKWKSTSLLFCHHRALNQETDNFINNINFSISSDSSKANAAETNFKLDFFEYYGLLERALVNLLECFSIVISADYTSDNVPLPMGEVYSRDSAPTEPQRIKNSIFEGLVSDESFSIGDSIAFYGYAHRFHANVLAALDQETNPLHSILGTGKVRQYLGLAKEFRNRWKEAELEVDNALDIPKPYHQILSDLRLDELLEAILSALEQSRLLTMSHLASAHPSVEVDMINVDDETISEAIETDDAMDWD